MQQLHIHQSVTFFGAAGKHESTDTGRRGHPRYALVLATLVLPLFCSTARAQNGLADYDPLTFAYADYTYAWFDNGDAGDGVTFSAAASRRFLESEEHPYFAAVSGHFGRADDELALPHFGGAVVGLRQNWYRIGVTGGIDLSHRWFDSAQRPDWHRMLYGVLGWEQNDIVTSIPGLFTVDRDAAGIFAGVGALLQYTPRNMVDLRVFRVNYDDRTARFTTYLVRNDYLLGRGIALSAGVSYHKSSSVDTAAVHVGLTWLFKSR